MPLWTAFVDLLHGWLLGLAGTLGGNLSLSIGLLSLLFRLALLPATVSMAVSMRRGERMNRWGLAGTLLQIPLLVGFFNAIQRAVKGTELARPDGWLALACAAVAGLGAAVSADQPRLATVLFPMALTGVFLWWMSSGVAVYSLASGGVGLLQSALVRRLAGPSAAPATTPAAGR